MIGIYKITSPSGKVYIGQSINIKKRINAYKNLNCKQQTFLYNSFMKHGFNNHKIEVLKECKRSDLDYWEIFYIEKFNSFNSVKGLNLKFGGHCGGGCSEITKQKLRKPKTEEHKNKIRIKAIGRVVSEKTKQKHRKNMLGNKNLLGHQSFLGKNHSIETINKIKKKRKLQIMPKGYNREFSKEWKRNMCSVVVINSVTGVQYTLSEVSKIHNVKKLKKSDIINSNKKYKDYEIL